MVNFTTLDVFWAVAFLLLMVGGAFFFYRLARRSESDFFLAGRRLRFRAVNYGTIPDWHPGAGGEAFIFVDELIVRRRDL